MKPILFSVFLFAGSLVSVHADYLLSENQEILIPGDFDGIYLNIVTAETATSEPASWETGPWINLFFGGVGIATDELFRPVVADAGGRVLNLSPGSVVDGGSLFSGSPNGSDSHMGGGADQFAVGVLGYIGFSYRATTLTSDPSFGWMAVTLNNSGGGLIHSWGVQQTPNTAVTVGAIPEPATMAALAGALSLAVVVIGRRRRKA